MIILATTSSFGKNSPELLDMLAGKGYTLKTNPYNRKLSEDELTGLLKEHSPVGLLAGTEPITEAAIETAKDYLKVISRVGVGWDNVNREYAAKKGIQVFRTVGVLNQAVAELGLGMILAALRHVTSQDRQIRNGIWKKQMGRLLAGKTVGIIGFGEIGQCLGRMIHAVGGEVIFHDKMGIEVDWASPTRLDELLARADIISLHASGEDQVLGVPEFEKIGKKEVIIVNMARGGSVDESALTRFLKDNPHACACLDVFEKEPYTGELADLENTILTSHIGSYAAESRIEMEKTAVVNLLKGLSPKVSKK